MGLLYLFTLQVEKLEMSKPRPEDVFVLDSKYLQIILATYVRLEQTHSM